MHKDTNERLAELESQIAFQDDTIQTLNEIVTRQELQLERLNTKLEQLLGQVQDLSEAMSAPQADEPPPPHY